MNRPPTQIQVTGIALAALLTLAACSGSDPSSETAVSTPSTAAETTTPTTDADTTTTLLPPQITAETQPPATAAETTTAPTTTTATTTVEQDVAAAAIEAREAYLYAVYNVDAPDALDRLKATHTPDGESLAAGLSIYQQIVDNGWRARANPEIPSSLIPESIEFVDATTAEVIVCVISAGVIFAPGAADDGSDLIINDEVEAARNRAFMVLDSGTWKLDTGANIETWEGPTCED